LRIVGRQKIQGRHGVLFPEMVSQITEFGYKPEEISRYLKDM